LPIPDITHQPIAFDHRDTPEMHAAKPAGL